MDEISMSANPAPKTGPKDVFLHLLAIVTLYASVISFIALLWQYIDVWMPDPLTFYYDSSKSAVRWAASVLVVMFPVYVFVSYLINKEPERREIRIRKWLIYLTLFISAITVIVDIITLVYNLMGGEITSRFILKVLVVLVTAGAVFAYYLWDLRKDGATRSVKMLAWSVSAIVAAAIVGGFFVIGSPTKQRNINFDNRKVQDLQTIQNQVVYHWQAKGILPPNLSALNDNISGFSAPKDPQTGMDYEYSVKGLLSFELCANFNEPSTSESMAPYPKPVPYYEDGRVQNWNHGAGRTCFTRDIDPLLIKPLTPATK